MRSDLFTLQLEQYKSIVKSSPINVNELLKLFDTLSLPVRMNLNEHLFLKRPFKFNGFEPFIKDFYTLSHKEQADLSLEFESSVENTFSTQGLGLPRKNSHQQGSLPRNISFPPPPLSLPLMQNTPLIPSTNQFKPFSNIPKTIVSRVPLKILGNDNYLLAFFKDCKHAGNIPAELFIQLGDLFSCTKTYGLEAHIKQTGEKSWSFPCMFYLICEGKIHGIVMESYTKLLSEVLYTFCRKQAPKLIGVIPTIIKAHECVTDTTIFLEPETKTKILTLLNSLIKHIDNSIFFSLNLRFKKIQEMATSVGFNLEKYPEGILSTKEDAFSALRTREEERLLKHLDHFLLSFINEVLYTVFQLNSRHGWVINNALKNKKEKIQ